MQVYINYPNPHFTIHKNKSCTQIQMHQKGGQRRMQIRQENLCTILRDFIDQRVDFRAEAKLNDLWLNIELASSDQEFGLVYVIQAILGQRYKPLGSAFVSIHC